MTYFLEKYYVVDYDGKLQPERYGYCLIRPCQWDYDMVLDFMNRKLPKKVSLRLEGQIAMFSPTSEYNLSNNKQDFKSTEEWLIWLELNKGITPDFEETHIHSIFQIEDYIAKTVDLHTNEVLYDSIEETVAKIRAKAR